MACNTQKTLFLVTFIVFAYKSNCFKGADSIQVELARSAREVNEGNQTIDKGGNHGHFTDGIPISTIAYCAVAFLLTVFIVSSVLCCWCEVRKKRRARDEYAAAPLEEVVPENSYVGGTLVNVDTKGENEAQNGTTQVQEGKKIVDKKVKKAIKDVENKAELANDEDKLTELPKKTTSSRKAGRLSDTAKAEILRDGGTLGKEGRTELVRSHVIMKEILGEGAFGDVYKAQAIGITENQPFTDVAVKILKDASLADEDFKKELKILMTFEPHPNIIQLMGACTEKEPYFLVLEFANVGDLRAFLHKKRSASGTKILEPAQIIKFAVQIAKGMEYIESKHCIHRDLATRNILLSSVDNELVCKLSDFGLARTVNNKEEYNMKSDARVPVRWMAPECIRDNLYTTKSDVWSFGVVCWELVTMGSHPYGGYKAKQVIKMVLHGQTLEKPENCSNELYDVIMKSCWQQKYSRRPRFINLREQLEVMLAKAEDYISRSNLDESTYVYLKPGNWDNSDGDSQPKQKRGAKKKSIPNNYELQFEGRKSGTFN